MLCQYPHADCRAPACRDGLCRGHWRTANLSSFEDPMDEIR